MQGLILEPFAGLVFEMSPGQTTALAGLQHSGVFCGMILVALACRPGAGFGSLKAWTIAGCIASALMLFGLVAAGAGAPGWPLKPTVVLLGVANGAFAVAAIGSMMELAGQGRKSREGVRMGLWGASQAIAFGVGGFGGAMLVDVAREFLSVAAHAYMAVFAAEAALFLVAAAIATRAIVKPALAGSSTARECRTAVAG
jgi:BCD family chlorophyll transporter-like MFS transporter